MPARKSIASSGAKLPIVEPGKKPSRLPSPRAGKRGRSNGRVIVGADRDDGERREIARPARRRLAQRLARDVDRDIGGRRLERVAAAVRTLRLAPLPNSTSWHARPDKRGDLAGVLLEDRHLGARRIVFRQLADLLEQRRAARVVEKVARDRLCALRRGPTSTASRKLSSAGARSWKTRQVLASSLMRSSASRMPPNAQRARAGRNCDR